MIQRALLLAAALAATAHAQPDASASLATEDGGPPALRFLHVPPVSHEQLHRVRDQLAPPWQSPDRQWSLRLPTVFKPSPAAPDAGPPRGGELGRFADPDDPRAAIRVGYVAGPVRGDVMEMVTVVQNVLPRLQQDGAHVEPTMPQPLLVHGRPAVLGELRVTPGDGGPVATTHLYAYIHNGERPGIMVHAQLPTERLATLRPLLWASVLSLQPTTRATRVLELPDTPQPPDRVPFPLFLLVTAAVGVVLLRVLARQRP